MNLTVSVYKILSVVSGWIEAMRVALLVRVYGIDKNEKPPAPWRKREGLPDPGLWPTTRLSRVGGNVEERIPRQVMIVGKQKVGPVRPVPAKLDMDPYVAIASPVTEEEAYARLRKCLESK